MVPFSFAGETFSATPGGALFWPAQKALLVADLHLEKASWFARLGQFLPPYDSHATLSALARNGKIDLAVVDQAIKTHNINAEKSNPATS